MKKIESLLSHSIKIFCHDGSSISEELRNEIFPLGENR